MRDDCTRPEHEVWEISRWQDARGRTPSPCDCLCYHSTTEKQKIFENIFRGKIFDCVLITICEIPEILKYFFWIWQLLFKQAQFKVHVVSPDQASLENIWPKIETSSPSLTRYHLSVWALTTVPQQPLVEDFSFYRKNFSTKKFLEFLQFLIFSLFLGHL